MEWYVQILGDNSDLQELSKSLNSPELCISQEDQKYVLKSSNFDQLKNAADVRKRAEEILSLLNGTAKLALGTQQLLILDAVVKVSDDGKKVTVRFLSDTMYGRSSTSTSLKTTDGKVQITHPADPIPVWIKTAQINNTVATVFRLIGASALNWIDLYKVYEIIESDVGGKDKIADNGWATKGQIKLFTQTAQAYRHGKLKNYKPPKKPMTLSEAESLIKRILRSWLRAKSETSV
jgi:hypothetical protein